MRKTRTLMGMGVAAVLGGTVLAGASYADGDERFDNHGEHGMGLVAAIDADRDGTLTQGEIDKARTDRNAALAAHDSNDDSSLTLSEFAHLWRQTMRSATVGALQRLDTDGEAVISRTEYEQPLGDFVQRLDRNAAGSDQRVVASLLDDPPPVEDGDPVCGAHGLQSVGEDDQRPVVRERAKPALHGGLVDRVEGGGRFVQKDDRRVLQAGAGDGDPLTLSAGERGAAFAHARREPFGLARHDFVDAREARCLAHVLV